MARPTGFRALALVREKQGEIMFLSDEGPALETCFVGIGDIVVCKKKRFNYLDHLVNMFVDRKVKNCYFCSLTIWSTQIDLNKCDCY